MIEAPLYPYIPSEKGIPFDTIPHFDGNILCGEIQGGSGRQLVYSFETMQIAVQDSQEPHYKLFAEVLPQSTLLGLDLQTKEPESGFTKVPLVKGRHKDMFAREFVEFAIDFFQRQGHAIEGIRGQWYGGSDNFRTFLAEHRKTRDKVAAAKSTWTGRLATSLGFTQTLKDDVIINANPGYNYIIAYFRKENTAI